MDDSAADAYVKAVCAVISSGRFKPGVLDSVYFGGGTPPLLGALRLGALLETAARCYGIAQGAEITVEVNPVTAGKPLFTALKTAGFNRVSIGVQSALDSELAALGRPHTAEDAEKMVIAAHESGFDNISCDLMLAIPGQTAPSLRESVHFITGLPITHISAYLLKIEPGTAFAADPGPDGVPDDDMAADLYLDCVRLLSGQGFKQYEISNFSKPGFAARHNMKYWRGEDYLGIGPAAHSCLGGRRFFFRRGLADFIKDPFSAVEDSGPAGGFDEYVMLRLRLAEGLCLQTAAEYDPCRSVKLRERAELFIMRGLMTDKNNALALTPEGFLVSNSIIAALLAEA
jgi:oxygen-independent coproporphyrinogen-3 oxidase